MEPERRSKAERLRALIEEFSAELPRRVKEIREAWQQELAFPNTPINAEGPLRRQAHNLAGAAGTFGHRELGEEARNLERELIALGKGPTSSEQVKAVHSLIERLEQLAGRPPQGAAPQEDLVSELPSEPGLPSHLLYLLEDDALMAQEVLVQLEAFGYQVCIFSSPRELLHGFQCKLPAALLADIVFPEGAFEGTRVVGELWAAGMDQVPVIFISAHDHWEAHLAALRAGGQAYFPKPIDFPTLIERLDRLTGKKMEAPYRILVMDDDPLLARHYAQVLEGAGMEVRVLRQPEGLFEALSSFDPDLLLTDVYMPGCTGIEAAAIIRQNSTYLHLPIVYLSGERSTDAQLEALRIGGDDFLEKPIRDTHLVAAIEIRARRFRALSSLMQRDSLTGLLNHVNLKTTLAREISQARRRKALVSVAMIDIDHFKRVNDEHGHAVGDGVIKSLSRLLLQRLRQGDIPARYGGEEFTLILPDTGPESALKVVDQLREAFATLLHRSPKGDFHSSFSAGIASIPPHSDVESILKAADAALYEAKRAGRNRVRWGGSTEEA